MLVRASGAPYDWHTGAATLCLGLVLMFLLAAARLAAGADANSPYTLLYDMGRASPDPWPAEAMAARTGWKQLAEDDLTHTFRGDVVFANDRLSVVLRATGSGAEVYAHSGTGLNRRARLAPLPASGDPRSKRASIRIVENNPGAVMVEATYTSLDGELSLAYRLTTGQPTVEVKPGGRAARLFVHAEPRYLVMPDFFGDDMVFDRGSLRHPRLGLPSENFLLGMLDDGNAMLMCVWPSSQQQADALLDTTPGVAIQQAPLAGCEIGCLKDKSIWVAFLEGKGIWHEQSIPTASPAAVNLDWKPPFAARWRADFLGKGGLAESWDFRGAGRTEESAVHRPGKCPCLLDAGRATVQLSSSGAAAAPSQRHLLVIYPIDRNRATPLATFCPMDILRNTLGVGPCQYVLEKEGLASEANPTPDAVMSWVETQFKKKRQKKAADEIRELLGQMAEHVKRAQDKIDRYGRFARHTRDLMRTNGAGASLAERLLPIIQDIERIAAADPAAGHAPERAARLAGQMAGLIGRKDALAECQRLGEEARLVGAEQDGALSKCRMAVRWLRQQCRSATTQDGAGAELARRIELEADRILSK